MRIRRGLRSPTDAIPDVGAARLIRATDLGLLRGTMGENWFGTKRTCQSVRSTSAIRGISDRNYALDKPSPNS
jgi:hypothetical protein